MAAALGRQMMITTHKPTQKDKCLKNDVSVKDTNNCFTARFTLCCSLYNDIQVSTKLISVLGQDIAFNAVPKWLHITISG